VKHTQRQTSFYERTYTLHEYVTEYKRMTLSIRVGYREITISGEIDLPSTGRTSMAALSGRPVSRHEIDDSLHAFWLVSKNETGDFVSRRGLGALGQTYTRLDVRTTETTDERALLLQEFMRVYASAVHAVGRLKFADLREVQVAGRADLHDKCGPRDRAEFAILRDDGTGVFDALGMTCSLYLRVPEDAGDQERMPVEFEIEIGRDK